MNSNILNLPEDCAKQWEILLLLISSEEKKIDRTNEGEIESMQYLQRNKGVSQILLQWLQQMHTTYARKVTDVDTSLKSDEVSLIWRQRGNDKFRANLVQDSYKCYSKSTVYAHQNGPMYPLALANRSAALLKMKKFKECLSDIVLALNNEYPKEQQHKLLLRRTDCYIELGRREDAQKALAAAIDYAATLHLTTAHTTEFERHIKMLERKIETIGEKENISDEVILPPMLSGENPNFNAASNAIELRFSETGGRYVAAKESLRRGDVLFSEEPYAWVTLPSDDPVCEFCCQTDINLVPCTKCSRSIYCSELCREKAASAFHMWECVGAQSALFRTIGIAHLALRVLLITASKGFPSISDDLSAPTTAAELFRSYAHVDNIDIYRKDTPAFYRMFNLVTNFEKMNNGDYIQYALTAAMLTIYLEHFTTFFDYLPSRIPYVLPPQELRLFASALILKSLGQLICNGHAALSLALVEENDGKDGRTLTEREVRRATAIYPSAAMMNHSCDPNIVNTFFNSRLIIRCSRETASGGEVYNCYGPHRAREPIAHRRAQLRAQYMFTCNCSACIDTERRDFVQIELVPSRSVANDHMKPTD